MYIPSIFSVRLLAALLKISSITQEMSKILVDVSKQKRYFDLTKHFVQIDEALNEKNYLRNLLFGIKIDHSLFFVDLPFCVVMASKLNSSITEMI